MRTKLMTSLAAAVVVGAALVAGPIAASAAPYTPGTTGPAATVNGLTVGLDAPPGSFAPNDAVTFSATGPGTASLALFLAAVSSGGAAGTSSATGALSTSLTMSTAGAYDIVLADTHGNTVSASVSVGSGSPDATPGGAGSGGAGGGLADTGSNISLATVWGAAGLIVIGAGALVTRGVVRRRHPKTH